MRIARLFEPVLQRLRPSEPGAPARSDSIIWAAAPDPAPPLTLDFDAFDLSRHPILGAYGDLDAVSRAVEADIAEDVAALERFLDAFPNAVETPEFADLRAAGIDRIRVFADRPEFRTTNDCLIRIRQAIEGRMDDSETEVVGRQLDRLRLEVFRFVFFTYWTALQAKAARTASPAAREGAAALDRAGLVSGRLEDAIVETLNAALAEEIRQVRAQSGERPVGRYDRALVFDPLKEDRVGHLVEDVLERCGILDVASAYRGMEMRLSWVTLHLSRPGDSHLHQTFDEPGFRPATLNMHFDPKQGHVKALLYLNRPDEGDGPICYVPGTHRFACRSLPRLAGKANHVTNYLQTETERRAFMKLPPSLRANAFIGSFAETAPGLRDFLLTHEVKLTAARWGNIHLFDPGGIHRGGLCREDGERLALQIIISPWHNGRALAGL